jgi:hypothetical protein
MRNTTVTYIDQTAEAAEGEILGKAPLVHGGFSDPTYVINRHGVVSLVAKAPRRGPRVEWTRLAPWEGVERVRYTINGMYHEVDAAPVARCRECAAILTRRDRTEAAPESRPVCECGGEAGCPPIGADLAVPVDVRKLPGGFFVRRLAQVV